MSRNTKKLEKLLADKGIIASVIWSPMQGEDGDGGIDGYYSEELQNMKVKIPAYDRMVSHSGWLGYSFSEASEIIASIELP